MSTYLCVKYNNSTKKYTAKNSSEVGKKYLRVKDGYFPLTTETTTGTNLKIKVDNSTYRIVETYTTTKQITVTTNTSYATRESEYFSTLVFDSPRISIENNIKLSANPMMSSATFSNDIYISKQTPEQLNMNTVYPFPLKYSQSFDSSWFRTSGTTKNSEYSRLIADSSYWVLRVDRQSITIRMQSPYEHRVSLKIVPERAHGISHSSKSQSIYTYNYRYTTYSGRLRYSFTYSTTVSSLIRDTRASTSATNYLTTTSSESYTTG